MSNLHPKWGLPTSMQRSASRPGCGCCAHCQCTGLCVEVEYSPDMVALSSPYRRSPQPSRTPSPMPPNEGVSTASTTKAGFLSVMESIPHPGDAISLGRKAGKILLQEAAKTPTIPSRRHAHSRSNSNNGGHEPFVRPSKDLGAEEEGRRDMEASGAAATRRDIAAPDRRDLMQEEYERGYHARSKRENCRKDSDIQIRTLAPTPDGDKGEAEVGSGRREKANQQEEGGELSPGLRRKEKEGARKETARRREAGQSGKESRRREEGVVLAEKTAAENVMTYNDERRRRAAAQQWEKHELEKQQRVIRDAAAVETGSRAGRRAFEERSRGMSRSRSLPRELAVQPSADGIEKARPVPETVSITVGPITLTRTRSRHEPADGGTTAQVKLGSKRELIMELIKASAPIPVNVPPPPTHTDPPHFVAPLQQHFKPSNNNAIDLPRAIDIKTGDDARFGSFNAVKKLSVHLATDQGLVLHFLDWSRRNERNEPLVAYRLQDGETGPIEKKGGGSVFRRKGVDWLQESHETGNKVKGKLSLGVGIRGPMLFHIDVKRRKVDKFTISGTAEHEPGFVDNPHYGDHDDYRHIYFETPDGRALKWHLAEPNRLMRLYGRGEKDYGKLYAEARMQWSDGKKSRGAKDIQLFFYDINHPDQPVVKTSEGGKALDSDVDYGFLCASWWCARQTFEESRLVEAHAEVELIENIEKAFEVDLLAGA